MCPITAKLLEELELYARGYSATIGHHYTKSTIRITALTGAAATEIGGETTAREFGLMDKKLVLRKYQPSFSDTRLSIVDEISFMSYKDLSKLSLHMQQFSECTEYNFGKYPIVFLGDFCQLECIGGDCIYLQENSMYWEQALTHMVELKGTHRYSNCPEMQHIMPKLRDHGMSEGAKNIFNSRVIDKNRLPHPDLQEARFATYHNKNRAEINATVFQDYLNKHHENCSQDNIPKSAIVIRAGAEWHKRNRKLTFQQRATLFRSCSEAHCRDDQGKRCDPLLCLFSGCFLMGGENEDVKNGIANGTTSTFEKIIFKNNAMPTPMKMHGKWVYGVNIDEVDYLVLRWHDCCFHGTFKVHPRQRKFRVQYPIDEPGFRSLRVAANIKMTFFPVVLNHATTGHKLQGKSLNQLVVAEWSAVKNWAYVVLSRVRTLDGLYLLRPIPSHIDFSPRPEYIAMMERLRNTILATPEQVETMLHDFDINNYLTPI